MSDVANVGDDNHGDF
jgi:hypothetical protein